MPLTTVSIASLNKVQRKANKKRYIGTTAQRQKGKSTDILSQCASTAIRHFLLSLPQDN
jgi:hypothetical protein